MPQEMAGSVGSTIEALLVRDRGAKQVVILGSRRNVINGVGRKGKAQVEGQSLSANVHCLVLSRWSQM